MPSEEADASGSPERERIRTHFFDNQAQEMSKSPLSSGPIRLVAVIIALAACYGLYQAGMYFFNYEKISAMKNVQVTFEKPTVKDGVAYVNVLVENFNPAPVSNTQIKYTILNNVGKEILTGKLAIPAMIPPGDFRSFGDLKLGATNDKAQKMQAELFDIKYGPKPNLTPELMGSFVQAASMDDKDAIQPFQHFVEQAPNFAPGFVELGLSYAANGNFGEAIKNYKKAISIDDNNADAHYNLGVALFYQHDLPGARKELAKAHALAPDDSVITASLEQAKAMP
jgi:tetratricopeptide (TPR) repeat protein